MPNLSIFGALPQNYELFLENSIYILKQIVWET